MSHLAGYLFLGLPIGCDFALIAVGLVLTFSATGVFNLGFGAQAFLTAFIFNLLVQANHLSVGLAFFLSVFVISPALGWVLDRYLFRHIPTASVTAKVVVSMALLVAIPEMIPVLFSVTVRANPAQFSFWAHPTVTRLSVGSSNLSGSNVSSVIVTFVVVGALLALLRLTPLGLRMRAVVESRRMAQLQGINAGAVSSWAWMLSSAIAGIAGILEIPSTSAGLDPAQPLIFTGLLVAGITAAAVASLRSIPIALVAGLGLGLIQALVTGYAASSGQLANDLQQALPFVVLLLVLLFNKKLANIENSKDPLASVDPPPPPPAVTRADPQLQRYMKWGWRILLVAFVISVLTWVPSIWITSITNGLAFSIICLSVTLVTGMAGQLSLCQATFAGIGAFTASQLALNLHFPVMLGMLVGAAAAAAAGTLIALVAMRLSGLILTIATLAFALLADNVLFQFSWTGQAETRPPRPTIFGFNFDDDRAFLLLTCGVLAVCSIMLVLVQNGTTGRFLAAMRGSPVASAGLGISLWRSKITVFVMSASVAAVGGAMFTMSNYRAANTDWVYVQSLVFAVAVITVGSRTVEGAVSAGLGFALMQTIFNQYVHNPRFSGLVIVLFALGCASYARHPEGAVEYQKTRALNWVSRRITGRLPDATSKPKISQPGKPPSGPGPSSGLSADGELPLITFPTAPVMSEPAYSSGSGLGGPFYVSSGGDDRG